MKILAYCRVSTDKQADSGQSIETQREQIKKYAQQLTMDTALLTLIGPD